MRFDRLLAPTLAFLFIAACGDTFTATTQGSGGSGAGPSSTGGAGATGGSTSNGGSGGAGATGGSTSNGGAGGHGGPGATGGAGGKGGEGAAGGEGGQGGGGPKPCTWSEEGDSCGEGFYCKTPSCGEGICVPLPVGQVTGQKAPVCGCDGVTYWNASVALGHGVPLQSNAACGILEAKTCGGIASLQCPSKTFCNHRVLSKTDCVLPDSAGTCWGMPDVCDIVIGTGPNTRQCEAEACTDECELIKAEVEWYVDNTCPM